MFLGQCSASTNNRDGCRRPDSKDSVASMAVSLFDFVVLVRLCLVRLAMDSLELPSLSSTLFFLSLDDKPVRPKVSALWTAKVEWMRIGPSPLTKQRPCWAVGMISANTWLRYGRKMFGPVGQST